MYYPYRSTTDKLVEAFQKIQEAGDDIQLPLYWMGGRDWIIVVRKAPEPLTEEERRAEYDALFGSRK